MDCKDTKHFAIICICCLLLSRFSKVNAITSKVSFVNKTGDFIIGGMFPIHVLTEKGNCGKEFNDQTGIQNLEAFLYSREKANELILKSKNITLGVIAYDTCDSDTQALDRALEFVKFQTVLQHTTDYVCADDKPPSYVKNHGKLLGVVGGSSSSVSIQLATFLRLFKVPQISYSATSPALSDTSRYEYFFRTVASDKYQAKAIVEILKTFEWKYVIGFYDDSSYGIEGFHEITAHAERANICIAKSYKVNRYFKNKEKYEDDLQMKLNDTLQFNNTENKIVAVLFVSANIANKIFTIANNLNKTDKYIWIGSDAWTGQDLVGGVKHALGIQQKIEVIKEFDDYLNSLSTTHEGTNPWFKQYREHVCSGEDQTPLRNTKQVDCKDPKFFFNNNDKFKKNMNTYAVMDAVYAFAHALRDLHTVLCGKDKKNICPELKSIEAEKLMPYLKNVIFTGTSGLEFRFVNNSGPARYSVMKYTNNVWKEIDNCQVTDYSSIDDDIWFHNLRKKKIDYRDVYKPSKCSVECGKGEAKLLYANKCCWTCKRCEANQYLQIRNQSCLDCPEGQRANSSLNGCEIIPETQVDIGWIISAYTFSSLGVIATSVVAAIFYWQKQTPLIMASGKELSFVLLLGILISYLSTFTFVAEPSAVSCGATRMMLGLSYTVVYAAILVKTNRIYRVFNINTSKPKKVRYIDAKSQLLITFMIVSVEIVALVTWLILDPADDTFMYPTPTKKIRLCDDAKDFAYLGALVYPFILMVLCVYYAIRTRKTPDGFNETRYITFGSYSFCVLWIAFTSIYFSVTDKTIRTVSLCFSSSINATVTLITLFITKTYVVIFRPEKNTRENVMSRRRTHSYDTVNMSNMNNLSRMASAVSTWHSVNARFDSEDSQNPTITISQKPKFSNHLSVSVVSMNNLGQSDGSVYSNVTSISAPPDHRHMTEEEVKALSAPFKQSSTDLGDERLKQFLEKHEKPETDLENGIGPAASRRSMRSFKSRRKRRRTMKRTRSLDGANVLNIPNIIVTTSSQEDNSVKVVKL